MALIAKLFLIKGSEKESCRRKEGTGRGDLLL